MFLSFSKPWSHFKFAKKYPGVPCLASWPCIKFSTWLQRDVISIDFGSPLTSTKGRSTPCLCAPAVVFLVHNNSSQFLIFVLRSSASVSSILFPRKNANADSWSRVRPSSYVRCVMFGWDHVARNQYTIYQCSTVTIHGLTIQLEKFLLYMY